MCRKDSNIQKKKNCDHRLTGVRGSLQVLLPMVGLHRTSYVKVGVDAVFQDGQRRFQNLRQQKLSYLPIVRLPQACYFPPGFLHILASEEAEQLSTFRHVLSFAKSFNRSLLGPFLVS